MVSIRLARIHEWDEVRDFCTNTFRWGDYIEQVWDSWVNSKSLLVYEDDDTILGICNVVIYGTESWIEGVRVKETARRRRIGASLLCAAEQMAIQKGATHSRSGIESNNVPSLRMYGVAGYKIEHKWHMYTCDAQPHHTDGVAQPAPERIWPQRYVNSWIWLPLDKDISADRILYTQNGPVMILADSERFKDTLMVTIHNSTPHNDDTIHYISNFAYNTNQTVQIFSTSAIDHKLLQKHDSTISVVVKQLLP